MKLSNATGNTLYFEDVDLIVRYKDGEPEEIASDLIKRSNALRNAILGKSLEIVEYDQNEQIEKALAFVVDLSKDTPAIEEESEEEIEPVIIEPVDGKIYTSLHGVFYEAGGYAKVNRRLALGLKQAGVNVKIRPAKSKNDLTGQEIGELRAMEDTQLPKHHISIDSVIPSFGTRSFGKHRILYSTIESYSVPDQFVEQCKMYNEIWLTSDWSCEILGKALKGQPIYTVRPGADETLYTEDGPRFDLKPDVKGFVFASVFAWSYRKGYDVLIRAFADEFSGKDDVTLLIFSRYQGSIRKQNRDKIKSDIDEILTEFPNKNLPHITRFSNVLQERDMPKLYRACNAFVLPSRGEGIGLPPLEASLCGLPVIMTNCSGQQDYLRPNNAYLIEVDEIERVKEGKMPAHYWDQQEFPNLTSKAVHEQLKKAMREVYENYNKAKAVNRKLQHLIRREFTWNNTINAATDRLKLAQEKLED